MNQTHGKRFDVPGKGGTAPMDMATEQKNPHHFIVGAQGSMPVDAAGNPWSGSYVHCNGNLLDFLRRRRLFSTDSTEFGLTGEYPLSKHVSSVARLPGSAFGDW